MASFVPVKLAFKSFEPEGGAGDKAPVIFIHGLIASKEYWEDIPQSIANATKRSAYAIDARNHGETEWTNVFSFDCIVDDLLHFMDSISAPKAILVGHSMGGIIGIKTALKFPERIEKLIIEDISVMQVPKEIIGSLCLKLGLYAKATEEMPKGLDIESAFKFVVQYVLKHLPPELALLKPSEPRYERYPYVLKPTEDGHYTFKANLPALLQYLKNSEKLLPETKDIYEGPACFIYGSLSVFPVLKEEDNIKLNFPKAEFFGIDGATHNVHFEFPQEYTDILLKFI